MFTEQEKEFMDAVAKVYCDPGHHTDRSYTMNVADAAYFTAKKRGEIGEVGEEAREAFFKAFMGGLMYRAEAQEYIRDAVTAITTQREQQHIEAVNRRVAAREAALEQMEIILSAAQEIQRLTTGIGVVPVFSKNSMEMSILKTAKYHISCIGNS